VTPIIFGRLKINRVTGTAGFEVLVSPASLHSVGRAVGHCSHCSKTPSSTRAHVEAFVDSSSATLLLAREYVAGLGTQSPFPASMHGAGRRPTVDRCSCNHP
jgi:hypothetical protein